MKAITVITIEGKYKSTLLKLLQRWLVFIGYSVAVYESEHKLEVWREDA